MTCHTTKRVAGTAHDTQPNRTSNARVASMRGTITVQICMGDRELDSLVMHR
jgi:hypothetical protein